MIEITAYETADGIWWTFWCGSCRRWHSHSAEAGYRVAHCQLGRKSRRVRMGYVLVCGGPLTAAMASARREKRAP